MGSLCVVEKNCFCHSSLIFEGTKVSGWVKLGLLLHLRHSLEVSMCLNTRKIIEDSNINYRLLLEFPKAMIAIGILKRYTDCKR